jgi:hypothetical protein
MKICFLFYYDLKLQNLVGMSEPDKSEHLPERAAVMNRWNFLSQAAHLLWKLFIDAAFRSGDIALKAQYCSGDVAWKTVHSSVNQL